MSFFLFSVVIIIIIIIIIIMVGCVINFLLSHKSGRRFQKKTKNTLQTVGCFESAERGEGVR